MIASEAAGLASQLLRALGVPGPESALTAQALVISDAWGVHSHGLLRLPVYLSRIEAGGVDPRAELTPRRAKGASETYDGNAGLGQWQVWRAAERAADLASDLGVGVVAVANSSHCGCLGVFTLPGIDRGLLTVVLSNGPAVMPPWGGSQPLLSTSPLAGGIPCRPEPAIVDLATTTVARGRIMEHAKRGDPIPRGWAFDASGAPTTDADAALGGMLAPLGGAKGYALAFMIEAMTAAMVGPALSRDVADLFSADAVARPQRIAHLVVVLAPEAFDADGGSSGRLDRLAVAAAAAGGRIPGAARRRPAAGDNVEVPDAAVQDLSAWAGRLGVDMPGGR